MRAEEFDRLALEFWCTCMFGLDSCRCYPRSGARDAERLKAVKTRLAAVAADDDPFYEEANLRAVRAYLALRSEYGPLLR